MAIELPELPYPKDGLAPHISAETIDFHYGAHHATYVKNLNNLIRDTEFANASLEDIISKAEGGIFNNAAQIWNHTFYWNSLSPDGGGEPTGSVKDALDQAYGSFAKFKEEFATKAATLFGSGWCWLVKSPDGTLSIEQTKDAGNPMTEGKKPLITCDVWEHAYYIDYRNARPKYVEAFWNLVNWSFLESNLGGK
jgi:Fe-Mn family superoxide dismutase